MRYENKNPYQVIGEEALFFPWSDSLDNLDPNNNGKAIIKKWNFRKIQLRGYFKNKASLGKKLIVLI